MKLNLSTGLFESILTQWLHSKLHIWSHNELGIDVLVERVNEIMFLKVKMLVLFWHEGLVCIFWKIE